VGLQAQALGPSRLAVQVRTRGLTVADVIRACNEERTVVRTWLMRGTLYMVAAEDLRWMLDLLNPIFIRAGRRRRKQLGLTDPLCEQGLKAIETELRGANTLTRGELMDRIERHGVEIDRKSQAPAHLVRLAALRGLICRGPDKPSGESSYLLLDDWVPPAPRLDRERALAKLALRYLSGHGPAGIDDFAYWSGLPMGDARLAFDLAGEDLIEVEVAGRQAFAVKDTDLSPRGDLGVRMLGHYDELLLSYKSRDIFLDPNFSRRVAAAGMIHPVVLAGGKIVGRWRLDRSRRQATITVDPFDSLPPGTEAEIQAETENIGRFLDIQVELNGIG
jgi:hypothetical protein